MLNVRTLTIIYIYYISQEIRIVRTMSMVINTYLMQNSLIHAFRANVSERHVNKFKNNQLYQG